MIPVPKTEEGLGVSISPAKSKTLIEDAELAYTDSGGNEVFHRGGCEITVFPGDYASVRGPEAKVLALLNN